MELFVLVKVWLDTGSAEPGVATSIAHTEDEACKQLLRLWGHDEGKEESEPENLTDALRADPDALAIHLTTTDEAYYVERHTIEFTFNA